MGNITISSAAGVLKYTLPRVLQASKHDSLSGEKTFAFRVRIADASGVEPGDVVTYGSEDYDVVRVAKRTAQPAPLVEISCEHVSYRLNECALEAGTYYDTPAAVLAQLLTGTGFSAGTVQASATVLLSFTSPTNVRAAVMSLAAAAETEILFSGYTVSLLTRIGSTTPVELSDRKNVEAVSVTLDTRSDSETYDLTLYKETALEMGDAVSIDYSSLGLSASARVISIDKDPFDFRHVKIVTGATVPSFVDSAIRALNDKVGVDQPYYGVTISRTKGIEIRRSDGASQAIFNSDTFEMDALIDGVMQKRIWFEPEVGDYMFAGRLTADALFTESLYAELGYVAELTVDRLTTSRRVRKYLLEDTSDDNYVHVQDNYIRFVTGSVISATVLDTEEGQHMLAQSGLYLATEESETHLVVQVVNRYGNRLYWQREVVTVTADGYPLDENRKQVYATTDVTDWPVLSYAYLEQIKAEYAFHQDGEYYVPEIILGAGDENGNSKGYIHKSQTGLLMRYVSSQGKNVDITFGDDGFVDAAHRRLDYCLIDKEQGRIRYRVEGDSTTHTLSFSATDSAAQFRWPDGFTCEVRVS